MVNVVKTTGSIHVVYQNFVRSCNFAWPPFSENLDFVEQSHVSGDSLNMLTLYTALRTASSCLVSRAQALQSQLSDSKEHLKTSSRNSVPIFHSLPACCP
jgi:hypothetical protein